MTYTRRQFFGAAALMPLAAPLERSRLGITTDEIDDDLLAAARFLRSFNLGYAEIRNLWGKYNTEQPVEKIREARSILDQHGLKTCILDTGFFKVPLPADQAALDQQWSLLDRAFERARLFGTDKIRVFAFTTGKGGVKGQQDFPRIVELLTEAARRARAAKMRLAIENVAGSFVGTGAEAARLLQSVRDPALGLTWDPNNAAAEGENPFPGGYRRLDPARIFHVHLRDYKRTGEGKVEWRAVGDGEFDNLGQLRALVKDGYRGTFALETHYRSPQGKEHATRTSLAGLLKVMEQV